MDITAAETKATYDEIKKYVSEHNAGMKALEKIIDYGVDRMVYISCKPTSLARDLEVLAARGYRVEKVCAVDMFPGTPHVETVALLSKL